MTSVTIEAGACGFCAVIHSKKIDKRKVGITIESECKEINQMKTLLESLTLRDILKIPVSQNPVYEAASKYHVHPGCPIPCGIIKAAEVELELSLKRDATILFKTTD